jgi:uncharacterized protein HemX
MALNPKIWFPIAVGATALNLVFAAFYTGTHAGMHAALAVGFGLWAERLRQRAASGTQQVEAGSTQQLQEGFEALEAEVARLRQELSETQERMDFVERVLAQNQEAGRLRK